MELLPERLCPGQAERLRLKEGLLLSPQHEEEKGSPKLTGSTESPVREGRWQ